MHASKYTCKRACARADCRLYLQDYRLFFLPSPTAGAIIQSLGAAKEAAAAAGECCSAPGCRQKVGMQGLQGEMSLPSALSHLWPYSLLLYELPSGPAARASTLLKKTMPSVDPSACWQRPGPLRATSPRPPRPGSKAGPHLSTCRLATCISGLLTSPPMPGTAAPAAVGEGAANSSCSG
jgi:hypothetical protein